MTDTLLQTKLNIPILRAPDLVPRPQLIEQINQGVRRGSKLTLVSAPAGFGKTTLVIDWLHNSRATADLHFAWLSLDEDDSDETRFLTYLVAALETIDSEIGRGQLAALQSPESLNVKAVLIALLNEIIEFPGEVVLILDDYHVIESRAVDEAVTFLLEHLPPGMHMVIASRIDPSLPLSRLRAHGQMTEVRAHDLRFTPDEAAVFLNKVMGLSLSARDISALEKRTEGWIAGLQLAALSLRGFEQESDIADFVSRFTGSDRYIQDYLADEVLQRCPADTRDFLLQTAILRRLCGPLCDAVRFGRFDESVRFVETPSSSDGTAVSVRSDGTAAAGRKDSQTILETLDSANLFLVALDNERRWYRYHHLFADLLAHRLNETFPGQVSNLHQRASTWYEKEGFLEDAFHHAREAGDTDKVTTFLEDHWQEIVHRGETAKLSSWLEVLGSACTRRSAPLSMAYCWINVFTGSNDHIPDHLKDVKAALQNGGVEIGGGQQPMKLAVIPSLAETMEAVVALDNGQAAKAKTHAQKAIALIPADADPPARGLLQGAAAYRLAEAHRELGEYDQACAVLLVGLEMLKASENYFGAAVSLLRIVDIYQRTGRREEAIRLCEDYQAYIEEHQWQSMPTSGMVYVILADLQVDSGAHTQAAENLDYGRGLVEQLESRDIHRLVDRVNRKLDDYTPPPQPLVEPLSPRELEVLELVAEGLSNREIGERLFLAVDTVKGHNRRIYEKLGVKNRTQAVNKAISLKIISTQ